MHALYHGTEYGLNERYARPRLEGEDPAVPVIRLLLAAGADPEGEAASIHPQKSMKKPIPEIISVSAENVESSGFFCYMSKKKSEGYGRKLDWLKKRFSEGMRIKLLKLPECGFIEYIPGEHARRAIHADGYLVIHCLWVVGKSKGKGLAGSLLDACLRMRNGPA